MQKKPKEPKQLMLPEPEQPRRQLHQSGVNMYNRCGMQFEFRYVRGQRRRPTSYLICGTATDKAVGWDLDTKIVSGELAKEDELTDIAAQAIDNYPTRDELQFDNEEESGKGLAQVLSDTKDKAVRLVRLHHAEIAPEIRPFRTARKFTVNLDKFLRARAKLLKQEAQSEDLSKWRRRVMLEQSRALNVAARRGLDFVGEMDIVEKFMRDVLDETYGVETFNVRDTKTSKASKNQGHIDRDDQLTGYATAAMVVDGRLPDEVMLDVLVDLKKGPKAQTLRSVRTSLDVDVYLNRIANAVIGVELGNFAPTQQSNWWCSEKYCAYTAHCPYFRQARRPVDELAADVGKTGTANDLLPILNKSVAAIVRPGEGEDE